MTWKLQDPGGTLQQRLSIAKKNKITDGPELHELRTTCIIVKNIELNLQTFIEGLQKYLSSNQINNSKRIKLKLKIYNSYTFDTSSCIAWIKKIKQNCYGQCGATQKEGSFCGFHKASKTHRIPITTIYDNIDKHILVSGQYHIHIHSAKYGIANQISGCNLVYWRGQHIYVNPNTLKVYIKYGGKIEHIGECGLPETTMYANYKQLVETKI
tara:strand:+ start:310 stop:945 length:636 start_codon:yes stop_codon:yes gene_type:complete